MRWSNILYDGSRWTEPSVRHVSAAAFEKSWCRTVKFFFFCLAVRGLNNQWDNTQFDYYYYFLNTAEILLENVAVYWQELKTVNSFLKQVDRKLISLLTFSFSQFDVVVSWPLCFVQNKTLESSPWALGTCFYAFFLDFINKTNVFMELTINRLVQLECGFLWLPVCSAVAIPSLFLSASTRLHDSFLFSRQLSLPPSFLQGSSNLGRFSPPWHAVEDSRIESCFFCFRNKWRLELFHILLCTQMSYLVMLA